MRLLQVSVETKSCRHWYEFFELPHAGIGMVMSSEGSGAAVFYYKDKALAKAQELFDMGEEALGKNGEALVVGTNIVIRTGNKIKITYEMGKAHHAFFKNFVRLYEAVNRSMRAVDEDEDTLTLDELEQLIFNTIGKGLDGLFAIYIDSADGLHREGLEEL